MLLRSKVLLITSVAVFLSFLDTTVVNIAFPSIRNHFVGSPFGLVSTVLSGYNVVFAAMLIPAGLLGDHLGRRRMFLGGLLGFVAASAVCAAAPSIEVLISARLVQAVAAAALIPSSLALVLPEFPLERRASATALWGATGAVAAAAGPTLGGLLVEYGSWRWVFLINLPIGVAAVVAGVRVLPHRRSAGNGPRLDVLGIVLVVAAIGAVTVAVTQGDATAWGWSDARTLAAFALAVVAGSAFVYRTARHPNPVVDFRLFSDRSFGAAIMGTFVFGLAFYALLLANVNFLVGVWHYSTLRAGLALSPSPLLAAVVAPITGRIVDRIGSRVTAVLGSAVFATACLLFASVTSARPHYAAQWLPIACLAGLGIGLTLSSFGAAAVATVPAAQLGAGSALSQTARQVGAALGVASFVAVLGTPKAGQVVAAFHRCWAAMATAALIASLLGLWLPIIRPQRSTGPKSATE